MQGHRGVGASRGQGSGPQGTSALRIALHLSNQGLASLGHRLKRLMFVAFSALLITGCAVQQNGPRGKFQVGLDSAALLGSEHAQFKLSDGSDGTLRSLNGDYSLKLERFFRVIPLGKKKDVQLERAVQLGKRTVLVLNQVDERGCARTALLAIQGSEVSQWEVKPDNCRTLPQVGVVEERLVLLYADHGYVYDDGKLIKVKLPPPSAASAPAAEPEPRKRPEARKPRSETSKRSASNRNNSTGNNASNHANSAPTATKPRVNNPVSASANVNATVSGPARASTPPKLVFGSAGSEEKPVVIHLE